MQIEITRVPAGEAPLWVRQAWIGIYLPLAQKQRRTWGVIGVISGPRSTLGQLWAIASRRTMKVPGYAVNAKVAVDLLATKNDLAAEWWRSNAAHLLDGKRLFVFDDESCDVVQST